MQRGIFICFEGGEGSGKTTMAHKIADRLRSFGHTVEEVADPGSTPFAQKMRELLLDKSFPCDPEQQALLYTAARRSLAEEIKIKLNQGVHVITGRWVWSTLVYQCFVQGVDPFTIEQLHDRFVTLHPDIYVLLDIDPAIALARKLAQKGSKEEIAKDRFESMDLPFHEKIREAYISVATQSNSPIVDTGQFNLEEAGEHVERLCQQNYKYKRLLKPVK